MVTFVVPPYSSLISTVWLVFQEPEVKSGTSIELERFATDHSLKGAIELHAAASYTSISSGSPLRRQSIVLQSIKKSMPPCPPTCLANSPTFFTIAGWYSSSIFLYSVSLNQFSCPMANLPARGYFKADPFVPLIL